MKKKKSFFIHALETFDWDSTFSNDLNACIDNFIEAINNMYCKSFPIQIKYILKKQFHDPWITSDLKKNLFHINCNTMIYLN